MMDYFSLVPCFLIALLCLYGLCRGVEVYPVMCQGARKGLQVVLDMLPALVCLFPVIWLFRASPLPEFLGRLLSPLLGLLGIPEECTPLLLLRPISGSAAMSAASGIISQYGADSLVGRTAAVMLGSGETSLYVIAVYFSAAGVKDSRWALPAALLADLASFVASAWVCRLMWA